MKPNQITIRSFLISLGVVAYVSLVALVMSHGNQWFGTQDTWVTPIAVLLLFTVSAAIVGGLVVGIPAYWFFNGKKTEAIRLVCTNIGLLVIETIIIFVVLGLTSS